GVDANLAISVSRAGPVAHQPAGRRELAKMISGRDCVADGQRSNLIAPAGEERVGADNKRSSLQTDHGLKDYIQVALGAGIQEMELQSQLVRCRLEISRLDLGTGKGGVYEPGYDGRRGHKLVQHFQLLL